jgi:RNA-splicing ligase RtcB
MRYDMGEKRWEHFPHEADTGVRGIGASPAEAFEQAAIALTAVITDAVSQHSLRGVAEVAPGAYKDVSAVVEASDAAHLARKVARLEPCICIKG